MRFSIIQHGGPEYELAVGLRDRVLRQPLGLQFTTEQLAAESNAIHLAGWLDKQVRACCILVERDNGWFQVRQVAVDFDFQRQGYGQALMEFAHTHLHSINAAKVFCHARENAEAFYLHLGYRRVGEYFEEVSIRHIRMERDFSDDDNSI